MLFDFFYSLLFIDEESNSLYKVNINDIQFRHEKRVLSITEITKSLFSLSTKLTLLARVGLVLRRTSWILTWVGLELNLLSFIAILSLNSQTSERPIKYFLVQSCASLVYIQTIIITPPQLTSIILFPLIVKLGAAPFHFWFPPVSHSLRWRINIFLLTAQKLAPLYLIKILNPHYLFLAFIALLGLLIGGLGGLNEFSLRKILAFSSVSHMGWIFATMLVPGCLWAFYTATYFFLVYLLILTIKNSNISYLVDISKSKTKIELALNSLSLRGFPPLLGFFPKWITISLLRSVIPVISSVILALSTVSRLFYLKITLSALISKSSLSKITKDDYPFVAPSTVAPLILAPLIWCTLLTLFL